MLCLPWEVVCGSRFSVVVVSSGSPGLAHMLAHRDQQEQKQPALVANSCMGEAPACDELVLDDSFKPKQGRKSDMQMASVECKLSKLETHVACVGNSATDIDEQHGFDIDIGLEKLYWFVASRRTITKVIRGTF